MPTLTPEQIYQICLDVGFSPDQAVTWTAIAMAESGGNTEAHNPNGEDSRGLWQVNVDPNVRSNSFGDLSDPDAWTAAQVDARRDRTVDQLAAEWAGEAPQFEDGLRLLGYELGSHYVGDLLQHAADVRHALGLARPDDDLSLAVALDFYLISFEETLAEAGVGSVAVEVGDESWTLGPGATVASLRAERFELFRALGGRRSAAQIRALAWRGDADAVVPLVSRYPLPATDLLDA